MLSVLSLIDSSAQAGHNGCDSRNENAYRVHKRQPDRQARRKAKKQYRTTSTGKIAAFAWATANSPAHYSLSDYEQALHKTIHNPLKGHHLRPAARRWVRGKLDYRAITRPIYDELLLFLQVRHLGGGKTEGAIIEDLSEEAKWVGLRS